MAIHMEVIPTTLSKNNDLDAQRKHNVLGDNHTRGLTFNPDSEAGLLKYSSLNFTPLETNNVSFHHHLNYNKLCL